MAAKLGTLLSEAGVITREQLEEALQAQVMFGGRIGTNLIELGFITEEFLAQFLSKQLRIPYCAAEDLQNISPEILAAMPRELAAKHRAVPVRLAGKHLWVAMVDPTTLSAVDEIAFATNLKVNSMIAPEVRVIEALERFYKIPKDQRYVALSNVSGGMELTHSTREFIDEAGVGLQLRSPGVAPRDFATLNFPDAQKSRTPPSELKLEPLPAAAPASPANPPLLDLTEEVREEAPAPIAVDENDALFPLGDIAEVLTEARTKEDIFQAIVSPFMEFFGRCAVFINKNNIMVGQDGFGDKLSKTAIEAISVPLKVPSIFRDAAQQRTPIFGLLPEHHNNNRIATMLERNGDAGPCLVCPMPLVEKVGVIVYADQCKDPSAVTQRLDKFQKMMTKAGLAFQVLVLKQKILHL